MLSKSKGLIVSWVAAGFHVLFHLGSHIIPSGNSNEVIIVVRDFVDMCNQHVAFIVVRIEIYEYIAFLIAGTAIIGWRSAFQLHSIVI